MQSPQLTAAGEVAAKNRLLRHSKISWFAVFRVCALLKEAGTDKSNLLAVNVFLPHITDFDVMSRVYDAWIDKTNPPPLACIEARLAMFFALNKNTTLRDKFKDALAQFPNDLPYENEEDKADQSCTDHLKEDAESWAGLGDRANYKQSAYDEDRVAIMYDRPNPLTPQRALPPLTIRAWALSRSGTVCAVEKRRCLRWANQ